MTATEQLELSQLLHRKYRYIDRKWDIFFWVTAAFVVGAAADITKLLFAGDWDFWTDWRDNLWWPVITPFAMIIIPSALQYIQWIAWRFPTGGTYTALCLFAAATIGRWVQWGQFTDYPMNFVWPTTIVLAGMLMDYTLLKTKSFILTSVIGGMAFALVWWADAYIALAPFLQPAEWMGYSVSLADVQGITYPRSQTPEYLRIIEHGSLRTFLGESKYVGLTFGATMAVVGYWIGQFIGRMLAVWPIGKFLKSH